MPSAVTSMIFGAFVAGAIAAIYSTDSGAVGLRAGFLAAVVGVLVFVVTVGTTVAWPLSSVVFFVFASGLALCIAPIFGLVCARVGGWTANTIVSRRDPDGNVP